MLPMRLRLKLCSLRLQAAVLLATRVMLRPSALITAFLPKKHLSRFGHQLPQIDIFFTTGIQFMALIDGGL